MSVFKKQIFPCQELHTKSPKPSHMSPYFHQTDAWRIETHTSRICVSMNHSPPSNDFDSSIAIIVIETVLGDERVCTATAAAAAAAAAAGVCTTGNHVAQFHFEPVCIGTVFALDYTT
jgi:hypothetical protein